MPRADDISVVHYVRLEEAECAETKYVTALLGISSIVTTLVMAGSNDSEQPVRAGYAAALSSKSSTRRMEQPSLIGTQKS